MNKLPGHKYPQYYFPDKSVAKPAFLLSLGDITESGKPEEWNDPNSADFASYLQATSHLMSGCKVYETLGNHDCKKGNIVRSMVAAKYGSTYYSFDVNGVHFVALDPYTAGKVAAPSLDDTQLGWLNNDLAKLPKQTPILIAMHIHPDANFPTDRSSRLDEVSSMSLAEILRDKNVLAIMHGHWHTLTHSVWMGINVLSPAGFVYGIPNCSCSNGHCSSVWGVIHITDNTITSLSYNWQLDQWGPEREVMLKKTLKVH